ncbi:MAG: hypothetical protein HRU20_32345, partial [Pseudomonadales bacterium]|nr:hypothetical protein [Pseudomonadales bacterium]
TIAKALLLHERTMMSDLQAFMPKSTYTLHSLAEDYLNDSLTDGERAVYRDRIAKWQMNAGALAATQQRIFEEGKANLPSMAGFMMKFYATELDVDKAQLAIDMMASEGLSWDMTSSDTAQRVSSQFLRSKGILLGGGTSEIQLNIIAKNVLGLPE